LSWLKGRNKNAQAKDTVSLAIGIWFCIVPLIFFLAVVFFDLNVALVTGVVLFLIILFVCNIICRISNPQSEQMK
jgi:ABC-type transport system involved in cytochrome bd biosynthesis fused ATPase/permease subunit